MFSLNIFNRSTKEEVYYLVVDIGTTGVKGLIFSGGEEVVAKAYRLLKKSGREPGFVEQDPQELYTAVVYVIQNVLRIAGLTSQDIKSLGITNQRETVIGWDRRNNLPVYPAIVWEDKRTKDFCVDILNKHEDLIRETTGLSADPYFSASKIRWIMKNVAQAEKVNRAGALIFGTVDTWILWNLTDGEVFATDYTNASRTMLFDIKAKKWSEELLKIFNIPPNILPAVRSSNAGFGILRPDIVGGKIPIKVMMGDQQASAYAAGLTREEVKVTYGTGTFIMQGLGNLFELHDSFFTTLIPGVRGASTPLYALEGKIACCGKEVAGVLKDPVLLKKTLLKLVGLVAEDLKKLPYSFKKIVVDGGVTQSEFMLLNQAEVAGVEVKKQAIYDGTSLGVCRLLRDSDSR